MTKVMVEIEIPDGHEITFGPTVDYSGGNLDGSRHLGFSVNTRPAKPLIICGKPADWPEWLICDWIAKDRDGLVCGYLVEPQRYADSDRFRSDGREIILSDRIDIDIPGLWEQSKRENPRRKK